jgi:hypothetical protein
MASGLVSAAASISSDRSVGIVRLVSRLKVEKSVLPFQPLPDTIKARQTSRQAVELRCQHALFGLVW